MRYTQTVVVVGRLWFMGVTPLFELFIGLLSLHLKSVGVLGGVIPAKNPIQGCRGRPERTYSKVTNGAIAIGS